MQEVLARAMGNAVVFEEENRRLRVTFRSRVGETEGVELSTVLTAMDVSFLCICSLCFSYIEFSM